MWHVSSHSGVATSRTAINLLLTYLLTYLLAVPRFQLNTYGRRAFSVAAPMAWNSLPNCIRDPTQTVLGIYLERTCSRVTSASSTLGVLNDYALYKSTHSLTHSRPGPLYICRLVDVSISNTGMFYCNLQHSRHRFKTQSYSLIHQFTTIYVVWASCARG